MQAEDELQRVRAARLYEPPSYFRTLTKEEIVPPLPGGGDAPLEVDLGCGDGGFLLDLAGLHPDRHLLGIEKLFGRARKVARQAARRGLSHVTVWQIDSPYAMKYLLPTDRVARLHVLFPDPWPKAKHAKNRLIQPDFCVDVHRVLQADGEWLFKTDHLDYFAEARAVVAASGLFHERDWDVEASRYPLTDFERLWLSEGKPIHRARFVPIHCKPSIDDR